MGELRSRAVYQVKLEGLSMDWQGYNAYIDRIFVEQSCDVAPIACVSFLNKDFRLTSDLMFLEKSKMEVWVGYPDKLRLLGTFILDEPRHDFPAYGSPRILVTGKGEAIIMAESEKRRVFQNLTDSEVAFLICNEYGLLPIIEPTIRRYPHIAQMGLSDINFLKQRARLYGFQVYVERGNFHFHAALPDDCSRVLCYHTQKSASTVRSFTVKSQLFRAGTTVIQTNRDKLRKLPVMWSYLGEPDLPTIAQMGAGQTRLVSSIANPGALPPTTYPSNEGHAVDLPESVLQTSAMGKAGQWAITAEATAQGDPDLDAGKLVTIEGIGHLSGKYLMLRSQHIIDKREETLYTSRLWLKSSALKELTPSKPVVVRESSSSGTARPVPSRDNVLAESPQEAVAQVEDLEISNRRGSGEST
jgi:hypothetical protein